MSWLDVFIPIICVMILGIVLVVLDRCNLEVSPEVTENVIHTICFCLKDKNKAGVYVDLDDSKPSTSGNINLAIYNTNNEATTRPHSHPAHMQAIAQTNQTNHVRECSHSDNAATDTPSSTGNTEAAYSWSQFGNDEEKSNKEPITTHSDSYEHYCRQSISLLVTAFEAASSKLKQSAGPGADYKNTRSYHNKSTKNASGSQILHGDGE